MESHDTSVGAKGLSGLSFFGPTEGRTSFRSLFVGCKLVPARRHSWFSPSILVYLLKRRTKEKILVSHTVLVRKILYLMIVYFITS